MTIEQHTLPCGATVLMDHLPSAHTVALGWFVRTGARDENADVMGVSHFLEHMMFKGTDARSAAEINRVFDAMGADYNAWTGHEATAYHAHVLAEYGTQSLDVLTDMMRPALRDEDFEMERNVILEEIGMYDDRPEWRLNDMLLEQHYPAHGLGYKVLGTVDTVSTMTPKQMRDYFEAHYGPDQCVLCVAGKFDTKQILEQATRLTSLWKPVAAPAMRQRPALSKGEVTTIRDSRVTRHYEVWASDGPALDTEERYALMVFGELFSGNGGSRLYWDIVDSGLTEDVDFHWRGMDGVGMFQTYFACDPADADRVRGVLQNAFDVLLSGEKPIDDEEVHCAATRMATRMVMRQERTAGRMHAMGSQWLSLKRTLSLEDEMNALLAVTAEDITEVVKKWLPGVQTRLCFLPDA